MKTRNWMVLAFALLLLLGLTGVLPRALAEEGWGKRTFRRERQRRVDADADVGRGFGGQSVYSCKGGDDG
jgi:hypothetical protein